MRGTQSQQQPEPNGVLGINESAALPALELALPLQHGPGATGATQMSRTRA